MTTRNLKSQRQDPATGRVAVTVTATLVGLVDGQVQRVNASLGDIVISGEHTAKVPANLDTWTMQLIPNDQLTPANTAYRIVEVDSARKVITDRLVTMVTGNGSDVWLKDLADIVSLTPLPQPSAVTSVAGRAGAVTLTTADVVGLGSAATHAHSEYEPAGSVAAEASARAAAITAAVSGLVNGAPGALDALNELATAMGNDPNFATTVTNALAGKADAAATATTLAGKVPTSRTIAGLDLSADRSAQALVDALATLLNAAYARAWQASTAYLAGDIVRAPDGSIVQRIADGTSGTTYTSTNWTTLVATKAANDVAYVSSGGVPGLYVDTGRTVNPAMRMQQETFTLTSTGDLVLTLGAPPINGKVAVWVKSGSAAPARLLPTSYTVSNVTLTIPTLLSGDVVLIEYFYDSDSTASPAAATTNQYTLYDDFNRTTTASTVAATAIGNAITGQSPRINAGGTWKLDGSGLTKTVFASNGDSVDWPCSSADGWFEVGFATGSGITQAAGLHLRAVDSLNRIHTRNNQLIRRTGGTDTVIGTFSATFVPGDLIGCIMQGNTFKIYRRAGGTGAWTLVCGPITESQNSTTANHGVRNADATGSGPITKYDYVKFIAGLTSPPAVS